MLLVKELQAARDTAALLSSEDIPFHDAELCLILDNFAADEPPLPPVPRGALDVDEFDFIFDDVADDSAGSSPYPSDAANMGGLLSEGITYLSGAAFSDAQYHTLINGVLGNVDGDTYCLGPMLRLAGGVNVVDENPLMLQGLPDEEVLKIAGRKIKLQFMADNLTFRVINGILTLEGDNVEVVAVGQGLEVRAEGQTGGEVPDR